MIFLTRTQMIKACMIMLSTFLKYTQQVDKENGDYTLISPINVNRSYVEVTSDERDLRYFCLAIKNNWEI